VFWVISFTRRSRLLLLPDGFLDRDRVDSGVADGEVEDPEVVILMILRLRILALIQERDMVTGRRTVGGLDSGAELLEELLPDTWLGTEATDKSQPLREETLGLVVTALALPALLDALQAPALLRDMRALDLVPRQEDNWGNLWYYSSTNTVPKDLGNSQRNGT
jgi:hypothetical protein